MTVCLLCMCLHPCVRGSLHFKPNHRTHWPVSQFGHERVWVIRFACPLCWWLGCCRRRSAAPYLGSSLQFSSPVRLFACWFPHHNGLTDILSVINRESKWCPADKDNETRAGCSVGQESGFQSEVFSKFRRLQSNLEQITEPALERMLEMWFCLFETHNNNLIIYFLYLFTYLFFLFCSQGVKVYDISCFCFFIL